MCPPVYLRIARHILQSGWELRHAVEVPSQAHMLHAGHCHDVLDVPHLALEVVVVVVGQVVVVLEYVVVVVVRQVVVVLEYVVVVVVWQVVLVLEFVVVLDFLVVVVVIRHLWVTTVSGVACS